MDVGAVDTVLELLSVPLLGADFESADEVVGWVKLLREVRSEDSEARTGKFMLSEVFVVLS